MTTASAIVRTPLSEVPTPRPTRRLLLQRVVGGKELRLYDMPWRTPLERPSLLVHHRLRQFWTELVKDDDDIRRVHHDPFRAT